MVGLRDYRRIFILVLIMFGIVVVIGGQSLLVIYHLSFVQERNRLEDIVRTHASFINATIDMYESRGDSTDEIRDKVISLVHTAHHLFTYKGFGDSGTMVLAMKDHDDIRFIFIHPRPDSLHDTGLVLPLTTERAAPMRAALAGRAGSLVGLDFAGERVLAAFAPISRLQMGIVAKMTVSELRSPFIRSAIVLGLYAVPLVGAVTVLFFLIGEPMVRELQRSEARHRHLFEHLRMGAAVLEHSADRTDFIFRDFNRAAENVTATSRSEVIGRSLKDMFPEVDLVGLPALMEDVWRTGREHAIPPLFFTFGRLSGWREGYLYSLPNGEIVLLFEDITERIRAQDSLREKDLLFRRLFNQAPCAICVVNPPTLEIIDCNIAAQDMLGYSKPELKGLNAIQLFTDFDEQGLKEHIRFVTTTGGREALTHWKSKRGLNLSVVVSYSTIEVSGLPMVQIVGTDISERVKSEARLRQVSADLQRATRANDLGQMASALSHELKQPLTAAMNYMNACRRTLASPLSQTALAIDHATKAVEQVERASRYIRDVRSFIGNPEPQMVAEDLNETVREAADLLAPPDTMPTPELRFDLDPELPQALIERTMIVQILIHLLNNAVEAMATSDQKIVTLSTRQYGSNFLLVAVRDTGPGVPATLADRLLNPFVTSKRFGLGIGLAICRTIVEAHGGALHFHNNDTGGATFEFTVHAMDRTSVPEDANG